MSQHTKGPWVIATHSPKEQPQIWSVDDGQVCELSTVGSFQAAETEAQVQANARLIAAAPELLEALKVAFSELNDASFILRAMQDTPGMILARAAIAKAENG